MNLSRRIFCLIFLTMVVPSYGWANTTSIAEQIRQEAMLSNQSDLGYPLPLAAHWNTGWHVPAYSPNYQLNLLQAGHYIVPSFYLPPQWEETRSNIYEYYESAIKRAAQLNIPICFISTQWESYLTRLDEYYNLPTQNNPNVVDNMGNVLKKACPFGPVDLWREVGEKWTARPLVQKLKEWYPTPPRIIFLSNNEQDKLKWYDTETSARYLSLYGSGRDDNFKRKAVGDGWIERYRSLQQGMLKGLESFQWHTNPLFVGYEAFGPRVFGRYNDWIKYSLYSPGRMEPWPLAWDGASLAYYVYNWSPNTDFTVMSPQIEAMNWVFMRDEAWRLNANYWLELSTWDGYEPAKDDDKRKYYASLGQQFNPNRYEGYVQFGMWLVRPRVVREFRGNTSVFSDDEPYFLAVVRAVDRVHKNEILKKFWRKGRLVTSNTHLHPYQNNIPSEFVDTQRWFLLDTDIASKWPWDLNTNISVYSLALEIGEQPEREWLVYAYSPLSDYGSLNVTLPGYGPIKISTTPAGHFYHIVEKDKTVTLAIQVNYLRTINQGE